MKQLLVAAILTLACFGAKAQPTVVINNQNGCEFEIRAICIDETAVPACTSTVASGWTTIPASSGGTLFTHPGCTGTGVMGYEIRYAASTMCSGSVYLSTNPASPCSQYPFPHAQLGSCSCSMNPNGPAIDYLPGTPTDMIDIQP